MKVNSIIYYTEPTFLTNKLVEFVPSPWDSCVRCNVSAAHLKHILWGCPRLRQYRDEVFPKLENITGLPRVNSWKGVSQIFSNSQRGPRPLPTSLILHQFLQICPITIHWKSPMPPSRRAQSHSLDRGRGCSLNREKAKGLCRRQISNNWEKLLSTLTDSHSESDIYL